MKQCPFRVLQPPIFMNSSNSRTRRLQHVQPLLPSWNIGTPGWNVQSSSRGLSLEDFPQERRLHVVFSGTGLSGSSLSSSSSGFGVVDLGGGAIGIDSAAGGAGAALRIGTVVEEVDMGFNRGSSAAGLFDCAGAAFSSTVECLPVVHGGMARNSSNVRTRGLQHFQPAIRNQSSVGSTSMSTDLFVLHGIQAGQDDIHSLRQDL